MTLVIDCLTVMFQAKIPEIKHEHCKIIHCGRSCSKLVISVTEHLVEVVDKLSTTAVVFFGSERILKYMCLYGA